MLLTGNRVPNGNRSRMLELYGRQGWLYPVRSAATIGALAVALFSAALAAQPAKGDLISLGAAANYGLLVSSGQNLTLARGDYITGNVDVGSGSSVTTSGINIISGAIYEGSGLSNANLGLTFITGDTVTASMSGAVSSSVAMR